MRHCFFVLVILLCCPSLIHAAIEVKKPPGAGPDPPGRIAASPAILEMNIGPGGARHSIKLYNLGEDPVTVAVSVHNWDLDEDNKIRIIPPGPQSLDQWILINPVNFTIPGKGEQTVRLAVRPTVEPEDGEHRAIVYFTQILDEQPKDKGITVTFRLGVAVYGLAGNVTRQGVIEGMRLQRGKGTAQVGITVDSRGNASIRLQGQYSLWREEDFPGPGQVGELPLQPSGSKPPGPVLAVGPLNSLPVLPGTRRTVETVVKLTGDKGSFVLFVRGSLGETAFQRSFKFTVP